MTSERWFSEVCKAEKVSFVRDGKRKVRYKFLDGKEMVEEYEKNTGIVLRRAWKVWEPFADEPTWEVDIGEAKPVIGDGMESIVAEGLTTPFITKRITRYCIEWRITNLPYPLKMYKVRAEPDECCITVSTKNQKFFKKIMVPDLERLGLKPEQGNIEFTHEFNTLIISYVKPPEFILCEALVFAEVNKLKSCEEDEFDFEGLN